MYFSWLLAVSLKSIDFKSWDMIDYTFTHTFEEIGSIFSNCKVKQKKISIFSNKMHFFNLFKNGLIFTVICLLKGLEI